MPPPEEFPLLGAFHVPPFHDTLCAGLPGRSGKHDLPGGSTGDSRDVCCKGWSSPSALTIIWAIGAVPGRDTPPLIATDLFPAWLGHPSESQGPRVQLHPLRSSVRRYAVSRLHRLARQLISRSRQCKSRMTWQFLFHACAQEWFRTACRCYRWRGVFGRHRLNRKKTTEKRPIAA